MKHRVFVTELAEDDLVEIVDYIFGREGALEPGLRVQERLERTIASLAETAARGRIVPELRRLGISLFREIIEDPWRIIFSLRGREVRVVAILDGRRSADALIRERALRNLDTGDG